MRIELECSCGARFEFEGADILAVPYEGSNEQWAIKRAEQFDKEHAVCLKPEAVN